MSARRVVHLIFFLLLAAVMYLAGMWAYQVYSSIRTEEVRTAEIQQQKLALSASLRKAGIPEHEIARGFWYINKDSTGNEQIGFFNLNEWAQGSTLTPSDLETYSSIFLSSRREDPSRISSIPTEELPPKMQFHNKVLDVVATQNSRSYADLEGSLLLKLKSGAATADEIWQTIYLLELKGEYILRDKLRKELCSKYPKECPESFGITIRGQVKDKINKNPVQGATVTVLSHPEVKSVTTDEKGMFRVYVVAHEMEKVRLSAVKRNFSEGLSAVIALGPKKDIYDIDPITLGSPANIVTIDTEKSTVTGANDVANPDGSFVLHTQYSVYEIPPNAIVRMDGTPYKGKVDVYLYEFTKDTVPESFLQLDVFDNLRRYVANQFVTFGMPYVQFFTESGEELHVKKSYPLMLTYATPDMQVMRDNTYGLPYGKLTDENVRFLLEVSNRGEFPLTASFLEENNLLQFPPFWVYERKTGVWENVGMKLLDLQGTTKNIFYTIN